MQEHSKSNPIPFNTLQRQWQEALTEAGYNSYEKIVNLVQEVKQEMAAERETHETQD